jgi:hypothetical protein
MPTRLRHPLVGRFGPWVTQDPGSRSRFQRFAATRTRRFAQWEFRHPRPPSPSLSPRRGSPRQPSNALWSHVPPHPSRALKGRLSPYPLPNIQTLRLSRPFRARFPLVPRSPGRCPGLPWNAPLGLGVVGWGDPRFRYAPPWAVAVRRVAAAALKLETENFDLLNHSLVTSSATA